MELVIEPTPLVESLEVALLRVEVPVQLRDIACVGALFRAERWRGRDNIRVSLRGPLAPGDAPSLVIPLVDAAAVAAILAGVLALPVFGTRMLLPAAAGLVAVSGLAAQFRPSRSCANRSAAADKVQATESRAATALTLCCGSIRSTSQVLRSSIGRRSPPAPKSSRTAD